jgi:hypothetical protein
MSDPKSRTSKADEVTQSPRNDDPDPVPSYGNHVSDDLYSDNIPNYQTGLPSLSDQIEDAQEPQISDENDSMPPPLQPAVTSETLSLTLDKALIFPSAIPSTALYSLNYTLNSMGSSITLRRSVPAAARASGASGKIMDKDLYDITRPPLDLITFQLKGKRKSTFPGVGNLQLKQGLRGKYWECRFKDKIVLKNKTGVWTDGDGTPVATETNEAIAKKGTRKGKEVAVDDGVRKNPGLTFVERQGAFDPLLMDLMVAVWCAKTWSVETYEAKTEPISTSEGGIIATYISAYTANPIHSHSED